MGYSAIGRLMHPLATAVGLLAGSEAETLAVLVDGEVLQPVSSRIERALGASRQPHQRPSAEPEDFELGGEHAGAVHDVHENVEVWS